MTISGTRHLSSASFEEYLSADVPLEYPVKGQPRLVFLIDPDRPAIGLRLPRMHNQQIPVTGLEHFQVRASQAGGQRCIEVLVTDSHLFTDAYPVLLAIADRIQLDGLTLEAALHDTLRTLGRLLEREDTLPPEKEVGLLGELLFLRSLIRRLGPDEAMSAWLGPDGAEHDFGLRGMDLEIKTTTAERRAHWIGSLTQLVPSPDRPLWLVSYQMTKAGADDGTTLSGLIDAIRANLVSLSVREAFEARLTMAGWRDRYSQSVRTRWGERSRPIAYEVGHDFPRITPAVLTGAGIGLSDVPEVRYRIDLSDRPLDRLPTFLRRVLDQEGAA